VAIHSDDISDIEFRKIIFVLYTMVYASGNREWEAAWVGDNPKWDSRRYSGKASAWLLGVVVQVQVW
jgi:hypothetical protein